MCQETCDLQVGACRLFCGRNDLNSATVAGCVGSGCTMAAVLRKWVEKTGNVLYMHQT
jgi:hypothetical protein